MPETAVGRLSASGEANLLEMSKNGNQEALCDLVRLYDAFITAGAFSVRVSGLEPDDLAQEGRLGLFMAIRSYKSVSGIPFASYAKLCIRRKMASAMRSASRYKNLPLNTAIPIDWVGVSVNDVEDSVISREHLLEIKRAFKLKLTHFERAALALRLGGMTYSRIAGMLGADTKKIDNALQSVKRKLKPVYSGR